MVVFLRDISFNRSLICSNSAALLVFLLTIPVINEEAHGAIANVPLYLTEDVNANILFDMSVETPMGGAAYNDQPDGDDCGGLVSGGSGNVGVCYEKTKQYLGYFDPNKCYVYSGNAFRPSSMTNANHECSGKFSGNFMNWGSQ